MSGIPEGTELGPIPFNIFVSNMDSGTECSLGQLTDTSEGRDVIQRYLNRCERWVHVNLMKFNMAE